jgi:hypothetical protein
VADEHDRSGQGPQELGQVGGVTSEITKRVSESNDAESLTLQGAISASKPVASAQAPWTRTIVGVSAGIVVTAPF